MTLPDERRRAVKLTRQWLVELLDSRGSWKRLRDIRRVALALLKHYPTDFEVDELFDLSETQRTHWKAEKRLRQERTRA